MVDRTSGGNLGKNIREKDEGGTGWGSILGQLSEYRLSRSVKPSPLSEGLDVAFGQSAAATIALCRSRRPANAHGCKHPVPYSFEPNLIRKPFGIKDGT